MTIRPLEDKTNDRDDLHKIAFISPFPLENCIRRLESRTEKGQIFAWDWQRRVKSRATPLDEHSAQFRMLFIPRSWLDIEISLSPRARGRLQGLKDGTTAVVGEVRLPTWAAVLNYVFAIIIAFSFSLNLALGEPPILSLPAALLAGGGILIFYVIFFWWWTDHSIKRLKREVRESLGDPALIMER